MQVELRPAPGKFHIYAGSLTKECYRGTMTTFQAACFAAMALAQNLKERAWIMEAVLVYMSDQDRSVGHNRIYEIAPGGGMPELMLRPEQEALPVEVLNGRRLELE